jgi:hypothetical protein
MIGLHDRFAVWRRPAAAGLLGAFLLLAGPAPAAPWSFAVAGDDRTNPNDTPDPTGINTVVFKKLLHAVAARQPRFLLITGDLVLGENKAISASLETQFTNCLYLAKTEAPDLTLLPVRGNHEIKGDPDGKLWLKYFKPLLDASRVAYFPQEEGFSYVYSAPDHPRSVFIAVDQYQPQQAHRVNLTELARALSAARSRPGARMFVFSHEMAFTCGHHGDDDNMAAFPQQRDEFVNLLAGQGCEYYFAGHDHLYDWMLIRHPQWPAGRVLNQIVAGTAGAPMYPGTNYFGDHHGFELVRKDSIVNTFGYLWVTVDEDAATNPVACAFTPL